MVEQFWYYLMVRYVGVSKNRGCFPPNHPFVHRVFHYFHHPFCGVKSPYFWFNTHVKNQSPMATVGHQFVSQAFQVGSDRPLQVEQKARSRLTKQLLTACDMRSGLSVVRRWFFVWILEKTKFGELSGIFI